MIKLLLVDDERIIREGIEAMLPLEKLNIRLTDSCPNAFEALESMENDMPDILLTDVKLPQMDGLALIERALRLNPALQCIVISGYDEFDFARKAMKMGVREYLLKPCTREEMEEAIARICADILSARQKMSKSQNDRDSRIAKLAEEIAALIPEDREHSATADQVRAVAEAHEGMPLLREAYTLLILQQEAQPEKALNSLKKAYGQGGISPDEVASGLNLMRPQAGKHREFVHAMRAYIHAHYGEENLSLQYLADHVVHMRADYIGREFARETGMKLSAYLLRVRMEKAKTMLAASQEDQRIYDVAEKVGLGHNPQYFSQLFRKYTGYTPKEYGKEGKNNNN